MLPALRSLRLTLHPYRPMLVTNQHVEWLSDGKLMEFSEQRHRLHTMRTQLEYARSDPPTWLIRCGAEDIGTISAYTDKLNQTANMGILVAPNHQGHGFGQEAWSCVMEWLFEDGIQKIEAGCREDNAPMRRLALATGMAEEARIPGHFRVGDVRKDLVLYGRFCGGKPSSWEEMWREPSWKADEARHS